MKTIINLLKFAFKLPGFLFRIGFSKAEQPGAYGHNEILRQYLNIPSFPSGVVIQHGWNPLDVASKSDFRDCEHLLLSWNKRYKAYWEKESDTPALIVGAPFVHYRRMHNITQSPNAQGTLAFPAHSTKEIEAKFDIEKYCTELLALPAEFQPVTICLHHLDILHYKLDELFKQRGFNVTCISRSKKAQPYILFYDLIKDFKFTTSNEPGSYTFYSVEMDIPFFILGDLPVRYNYGNKNIDIPASVYTLSDFEYGRIAREIFSNSPKEKISKQQKEFVLSETGMLDLAAKEQLSEKLRDIINLTKSDKTKQAKTVISTLFKALKHPCLFFEHIRDIYRDNNYFG